MDTAMTIEQFEELGFAIGKQIRAEKKQKLIQQCNNH